MIYVRVPASLVYRDVAMRTVFGACRVVGVLREQAGLPPPGPELGEHVVSAVGEAFNNAVCHAYRGLPPGSVEIAIEVLPESITVRVIDYGISFDPTHVPEPDLDDLPESGMGLFIMKRFMDDVRYQAGPPNLLILTKRLRR